MATVAELTTRWGFDVDTAPLDRMNAAVDQARNRFRMLGNVGRAAFMGITLPVIGAGVGMLKLAADAEEMESKFNAVFKNLAGDARQWSDEQAKAVGRSRQDVMQYMSSFQDTFVPLGFAREQSAELSKQLTTLTMDLSSFNNVAEPETQQLLTSALVGNHEAVRRFGVVLTETSLKQELMNMGMSKSATQNAPAQAKAIARLNIIMRSTTDAQGDAIRTAGSFTNQMRGLIGAAKDLGVEFGQEIIPFALQLVKALRSAVQWFGELSRQTRQYILIGMGFAALAGPLLLVAEKVAIISLAFKLAGNAALIAQAKMLLLPIALIAMAAVAFLVFDDLISWMQGTNSWIEKLVESSGVWANAIKVLTVGLGILAGVGLVALSPVLAVVVLLGLAVFSVIRAWDDLGEAWQQWSDFIVDITDTAIGKLKSAWSTFIEWIKTAWGFWKDIPVIGQLLELLEKTPGMKSLKSDQRNEMAARYADRFTMPQTMRIPVATGAVPMNSNTNYDNRRGGDRIVNVNMNVESTADPDEIAERTKRAVADELDRSGPEVP